MNMIKPRGRLILVKMIPVSQDVYNPLGLSIVDKKKHWDHASRRGVVLSVGDHVRNVNVGDVVIMHGAAGKTLDSTDKSIDELYRFVKESECEAIDETETERLKIKRSYDGREMMEVS